MIREHDGDIDTKSSRVKIIVYRYTMEINVIIFFWKSEAAS